MNRSGNAPDSIMDVIMGRLTVCFLLFGALLSAQRDIPPGSLNQPERLEWFRDQGFGMFIHWSVDSQTGVVISHSLAGADEAYTRRFFEELPKTFNPRKFEPRDWAALAKLAGIKYVVLHHQAPFRLRHVGHEDHRFRHHAHAVQARPDARPFWMRFARRASRRVFTFRRTISRGCGRTRSTYSAAFRACSRATIRG